MSLLDQLRDLPIGILPGTVPDAPAVPPAKGTPARAGSGQRPLTGRELALQAAADLRDILRGIRRLVELQETPTKRYLMAGSIAGGGQVGVQPQPLMQANANRKGMSVQNLGAAGNLTLGLGTTAPQAGTGITLQPGASWDGRVSGQMWRGSVSIVGSVASVQYSFLEV